MQCQRIEKRNRSSFLRRLTLATALLMILPVATLFAGTKVEMRSMEDVKALAGTWKGNGYVSESSFLYMTLVIREDGTYELTGSVTSKGTIKIDGNHLQIGPFDLWVTDHRKSRVLHGIGDDAEVAFSRRR